MESDYVATTNYNLPTITGNMTADVVRDMNALAEATDDVIKQAVDGVDTRVTTHLAQISVNVCEFGAVGDGTNDDAQAIRQAYAHLKSLGGGELYFPKPSNYYSLKSTITHSGLNVGLVVDAHNIVFKFARGASMVADVDMHSMFYASVRCDYLEFENVDMNANKKADYCFNSAQVYCPYMTVKHSTFNNAKIDAFRVATFVSLFERSIFARSKRGLVVHGVWGGGDIATSCTFNSCYALNNEDYGFYCDLLTYSTFNSCAVDGMPNGIAYRFACRGVTLNACGSEKVRKCIEFSAFRGVVINSFFAFNVGSLDSNNPTDYLFEFKTGVDASVSGIHIQDSTGETRYFNKKLGLTQNAYGYENITVVDDSIGRDDAYFVTNFKFQRPIKFLRGDETVKDINVALSVNDLMKYVNALEYMTINHTITITVLDGIQNNTDYGMLIRKISGNGKIIIQGNATDNTLVRIQGAFNRLYVTDCTCQIVFKNLTIDNRGSNAYAHLLQVNNAKDVILDNVILNNSGLIAGAAITAINNSSVKLINGTMALGTGTWNETVYKTYHTDKSSKIALDDGDVPTSGRWTMGMRRKASNLANGYEGVVCTASGTPGTWKGYGQIQQ